MKKIFSASAQGQTYFNEGKNNQDFYCNFVDDNKAIMVICDGCHGGKNSEVVARLSAPFLVRKINELLDDGLSLAELPTFLFDYYQEYLIGLVESQLFQNKEEVERFVYENLLCTVIGVVSYQDEVLLFNCGDGSFYLNDSIYLVRESLHNRPTYLAYNLLKVYGIIPESSVELIDDRDGKTTKIPTEFETVYLTDSDIKIIGISSDGLNPYPSLFDELRLHAKSQISLTLCLNRIVVIRGETTDNVTVSFLVKTGD